MNEEPERDGEMNERAEWDEEMDERRRVMDEELELDGERNEWAEWDGEVNLDWRGITRYIAWYVDKDVCSYEEIIDTLQKAAEFCPWRMFLHELCRDIYLNRCTVDEVMERLSDDGFGAEQ